MYYCFVHQEQYEGKEFGTLSVRVYYNTDAEILLVEGEKGTFRAEFSYKLRYIVGLGLVEMAISTNPKPTIYRNLYETMGLKS